MFEGDNALQLQPLTSCTIATVNTQGLNWTKIAHQDKLEILLGLRRKHCWDITCLTEIHNTDVPSESNQYQMVFAQETLCILGRAAGIVLSHTARQAWEKSGRKVQVLHYRILGIPLQSSGGESWVYAIYAPTGVTAAQYDEFLKIIEDNIITKHENLSEAFYLVGDWNAHIGRNSKKRQSHHWTAHHTGKVVTCTTAYQNGHSLLCPEKRNLATQHHQTMV